MVVNYRKKTLIIQAIQWTGNNLQEIIDFTGLHPSVKHLTWEEYEQIVKIEGLKVTTLNGPVIVSIKEWIIRGIQGEFYPCDPDIFEKTYEIINSSEIQQNNQSGVNFCTYCGNKLINIQSGMKFCAFCGRQLWHRKYVSDVFDDIEKYYEEPD
jgi:hypothetical protein